MRHSGGHNPVRDRLPLIRPLSLRPRFGGLSCVLWAHRTHGGQHSCALEARAAHRLPPSTARPTPCQPLLHRPSRHPQPQRPQRQNDKPGIRPLPLVRGCTARPRNAHADPLQPPPPSAGTTPAGRGGMPSGSVENPSVDGSQTLAEMPTSPPPGTLPSPYEDEDHLPREAGFPYVKLLGPAKAIALVCLNSGVATSAFESCGTVGAAQAAAADAACGAAVEAGARFLVVAVHHPPRVCHGAWKEANRGLGDIWRLTRLCARWEVGLLLHGHNHVPYRGWMDGSPSTLIAEIGRAHV